MPEAEDEVAAAGGDDALVGEGEGRPDHRVAGKRHLVAGAAEDAEAQVGAGCFGGKRKRALRKAHLAGHGRHRLGGQAGRFHEHRQLVAGVGPIGEHVVVQVAAQVGSFAAAPAGACAHAAAGIAPSAPAAAALVHWRRVSCFMRESVA